MSRNCQDLLKHGNFYQLEDNLFFYLDISKNQVVSYNHCRVIVLKAYYFSFSGTSTNDVS